VTEGRLSRTAGREPGKPIPSENLSGQHPARHRLRFSVGAALGLAFAGLLLVLCGAIILYMSSADRRIAQRVVADRAMTTLGSYELRIAEFFETQDRLLGLTATALSGLEPVDRDKQLARFEASFPAGTLLSLLRERETESAAGQVTWTEAPESRQAASFLFADRMLADGTVLQASYPQTVFADLISALSDIKESRPFLLKNNDVLIAAAHSYESLPDPDRSNQPVALSEIPADPLSSLWLEGARVHILAGLLSGRVFPHEGAMYTAVFQPISVPTGDEWLVGALYRAQSFGAAFDQTRTVMFIAIAALLAGAIVAYALGRLLGRPLNRLADVASHLQRLEFDRISRLEGSRLRELDLVNGAFNGATGALGAFARYVPRQLVQKLLADGMTGQDTVEIREMTIVFVDLAGFTGLAAKLSAEQTASFLEGYFETVNAAVSEGDGTIDKFLGDGVLAFWGAPAYQPDHAEKALGAVAVLAELISRHPDPNMRVRIGVHTGQVVVGNIGSADRVNYTVIGDPVNVAARLQEYGKAVDPDARVIVLTTGDTVVHLDDAGGLAPLGSVQLRGRQEAVEVYRLPVVPALSTSQNAH